MVTTTPSCLRLLPLPIKRDHSTALMIIKRQSTKQEKKVFTMKNIMEFQYVGISNLSRVYWPELLVLYLVPLVSYQVLLVVVLLVSSETVVQNIPPRGSLFLIVMFLIMEITYHSPMITTLTTSLTKRLYSNQTKSTQSRVVQAIVTPLVYLL